MTGKNSWSLRLVLVPDPLKELGQVGHKAIDVRRSHLVPSGRAKDRNRHFLSHQIEFCKCLRFSINLTDGSSFSVLGVILNAWPLDLHEDKMRVAETDLVTVTKRLFDNFLIINIGLVRASKIV